MNTERTVVPAVRSVLAAACPSLSDGSASDAVCGRVPAFVAAPASTAEASALLRAAASAGLIAPFMRWESDLSASSEKAPEPISSAASA